jgi:hypothetical protein
MHNPVGQNEKQVIIDRGTKPHDVLLVEDEQSPDWGKEYAFAKAEDENEVNRSM